MDQERNPVLSKVIDTEGAWIDLFLRMETDKDLYNIKAFQLKNKDGRPTSNVSNITLNDASVFASRVLATLNSASMQLVIEGEKIDDNQTALLEKFFEGIYLAVDEDLSNNRDIIGLRPFLNEQLCIRGRAVSRILLRTEGKEFIPEILPCDSRYFTYGLGRYGMRWGAYRTTRSKEELQEEYPAASIRGSVGNVVDVWDDKVEQVFIDDTLAYEQPNPLGYPPFVVTSCHRGSMLQDADAMSHKAESIFAGARNLYEHKNRIVSIMYTQHAKLLKAPMQFKNREGARAEPPKYPPYGEGVVVPIAVDEEYINMPIMDLQQAGRLLYAIVDSNIQKATLPNVDYGNLTFPLSAVAISKLTATRDMVFLPTLQALAIHYRNQNKMIRKQFIQGGFRAELGKEGEKRRFTSAEIKKLEPIFSCKYDITASSPEQDIANYSIAEAAQRWASDDTICRDILKQPDPAGEKRQRMVEMAEKVNPFVLQLRIAQALIEEGRDLEAKVMCRQMGISWRQLKSGKVEPEAKKPQPEQQQSQGRLPLLGKDRGVMRPPGRPATPSVEQEAGELPQ